jgi:DNA repair protein RadC
MIEKLDAGLLASIRNKQRQNGTGALKDEELIGLIIKRGDDTKDVLTLSKNLLRRYGSLREISGMPAEKLVSENKGLTETKALALKAAFELGIRTLDPQAKDMKISSPKDAADLMRPRMMNLMQEHFKTILLDTKNYVISVEDITVGTINSSLVHAREVFRGAILKNAYGIILVHNHPSQDPLPSPSDREITARFLKAGGMLGIKVSDHIIIGGEKYYSFSENGKIS